MSSANNFTTRYVSEEAVDILTAIHEECFPKYWNREAFTDFFEVQNTFATLVETTRNADRHDDLPRGWRRCRYHHPLLCAPPFANKRLHKKLLQDALTHCKQLGAAELHLEVEEGNIAAIRLYENAGFSHVRRRKLYYQQLNGSFTDALVMKKKLA